jgi:xanthine dehydrogenase YagR molybdenum-binding subunit
MARLIRTEKEVEGRYSEQWIVVEEDALEQWPEGPREIVGRPAQRLDGYERARGQAVYTADLAPPGLLHAAVLRSPHARARVKTIDLAPALTAPGVHAAVGPGDAHVLTDEPSYQGHAVAAVAADSFAEALAALELIVVDWEVLEPLIDADEAVRQEAFLDEPRRYGRDDPMVARATSSSWARLRSVSFSRLRAVCHPRIASSRASTTPSCARRWRSVTSYAEICAVMRARIIARSRPEAAYTWS